MPYSIRIRRSAAIGLARIARHDRERLVHAIDRLGEHPLAGTPLKGDLLGLRRIRAGDHTAVYEVLDHELVVLAVPTAPRLQTPRR